MREYKSILSDSKILTRKISRYDKITNILNFIKTIFVTIIAMIFIYVFVFIGFILDTAVNY